ncbi:MAG: hypothetical protein JXB35_06455 [Anaerolineae bacterium]|nr:hypothetical protein [Anaerolineae bacterium]
MISTVTTTTVTTVTTATVALAAGLSLLAMLTLLGVLIPKEIVGHSDNPALKSLSRAMNIAVLPLLLCFAVIVVVKVLEVIH